MSFVDPKELFKILTGRSREEFDRAMLQIAHIAENDVKIDGSIQWAVDDFIESQVWSGFVKALLYMHLAYEARSHPDFIIYQKRIWDLLDTMELEAQRVEANDGYTFIDDPLPIKMGKFIEASKSAFIARKTYFYLFSGMKKPDIQKRIGKPMSWILAREKDSPRERWNMTRVRSGRIANGPKPKFRTPEIERVIDQILMQPAPFGQSKWKPRHFKEELEKRTLLEFSKSTISELLDEGNIRISKR